MNLCNYIEETEVINKPSEGTKWATHQELNSQHK